MRKSILALALLTVLSASAQAKPKDCTVNINTAAASEISACLDGIGEKKAESIVDYREKNGKFESADDLTDISGIGEKTVGKNRDKIVIEDESSNGETTEPTEEPAPTGDQNDSKEL